MSPINSPLRRRDFCSRASLALAAAAATTSRTFAPYVRGAEPVVLGQGEFRYRVVPDWGVLGAETPVDNCPAMVTDREGHVLLLTDDRKNNVIVYDKKGRLVHKWGRRFPGAHGMSLVTEGQREVLYITDLQTHRITKTTLDGTVLQEWAPPVHTGKYPKPDEFRPSWTLHSPTGEFFVLDGYGRDYIVHYGADGAFRNIFGGPEGGVVHWGPHGGMIDMTGPNPTPTPTLLIAMSDQQYLLRLSTSGEKLQQIAMPGGNPRQIRKYGNHYFIPHLGDNWPKDKNCRGFVSVLDSQLRVVSNIAGTPPRYNDQGVLEVMRHQEDVFQHPHDLVVDDEQSLYVPQFASGKTYPIKLERV